MRFFSKIFSLHARLKGKRASSSTATLSGAHSARLINGYLEWIVKWRSLPVRAWIRGAELYQRGEFEAASELYKRGLAANPNSRAKVNALLDLSHCLFKLNRFDEAESYLRQATSSFPNIREGYVRLARLQLWLGYSSEALWTMRVCLKRVQLDPELLTLFINAVVESGGDALGVHEAREMLERFHCDAGGFPRLDVARARLEVIANKEGDYLRDQARDGLSKLASLDRGPFDAVVAFAEVLISEGKLAYARHHLHRALAAAPEHPRVLRLLALSYIHQGPFFEPDYAVQIALKACQITGWRGVHELYILAQAYLANEDKVAALMAATQAKKIAARLIGGHPEVERLERSLQVVAQESQM